MILVLYDRDALIENKIKEYNLLKKFTLNQAQIYLVEIKENKVLFVDAGYTKVSIALVLGVLINKFPIKMIIGTGNCGSLFPVKSPLFSVAIPSESLQYDVNFSAIGHPAPQIPELGEGIFNTNVKLVNMAIQAASEYHLPSAIGRFCSADQFVANKKESDKIKTKFIGRFIDSECAILGEIAYFHQIPYVAIKVVSNYCGDLAAKDYEHYSLQANQLAFKILINMLEKLNS